jgi:polyadenylation factor subunit 2
MPQLQPPAHMLPHQQGPRPSLPQLPSMPGSMPGPSPVNPPLPPMPHPMVLFTNTLSVFCSNSLLLDL